MTKIFVVRVNSLLSSADSTLRLGSDNEVVIPLAVIDELQNYRGKPEKKKIADSILEYLEGFEIDKLFNEGVRQANGSILKIAKNYHNIHIEDMEGITDIDKRIFQVCIGLQKEHADKKVVLVSKKNVIRIKARALGINAEDFRDDLFPSPAEQYQGRVSIETTSKAIDNFFQEKYMPISQVISDSRIEWVQNMFVEGRAIDSNQSFLGRYDGKKIVPLVFGPNSYPYGITAKNAGQRMLMECLLMDWKTAPLVIAKGGAGTGKTYLAVALAALAFKNKEVEKIILTRPAVEAGEKLGFLPGDLGAKVDPYLRPLYDALQEMFGLETFNRLTEKGAIEIAPLAYMRGRTLSNAFIILDEAQNATREQMKMFLTRMGEGSKIVVTGDVTQIDLPRDTMSGLIHAAKILENIPRIAIIKLTAKDVVRHPLVQAIVAAYEKAEKPRGENTEENE